MFDLFIFFFPFCQLKMNDSKFLLCVCLYQMEERKDSMLETAFLCFQGASSCEGDSDEEEWLIHYMLGKIAEKRKKPPVEYLQLYKKVWKSFFISFPNCRFLQNSKNTQSFISVWVGLIFFHLSFPCSSWSLFIIHPQTEHSCLMGVFSF